MSEERESLQRNLDIARRTLFTLEGQAAGYTSLTIPVYLFNEITAKRAEVASLKARLVGGSGGLHPNTLPQRDLFFGREDEINKCLGALAPESRSWGIIIDGIGGIGKTALAVEVAYLCQKCGLFDAFLFVSAKQSRLEPGGERAIPQAARTRDDLINELARAMGETGVIELTPAEKQHGLLNALRLFSGPQRRTLIILDNLETLTPDEQILVSEFLLHLPENCKAIVTSRKRADVGGVPLRLEKLGWDAARQLIAAEMDRADNLKKALNAVGQARWQELYDATGGSPLALRWTLGLMRNRNLSLDRVLEIVSKGAANESSLLEFMYREARSEMGADDWRVLGALSLFAKPAGFKALSATTDLTRLALESALDRLTAYSLVDVLGPEGPYGLHMLTRRMTSDELAAQPQIALALQRNFCHYWVDYAEKYGGDSKNAYQTFDRLEAEWPNLDAAANTLHEICLHPLQAEGSQSGDEDRDATRMLVDLGRALSSFLYFRGRWDKQMHLGEWAYKAAKASGGWSQACWQAYDVAWIHYNRAETGLAARWADCMAEAAERSGGSRDRAAATYLRGLIAWQGGDTAQAEQFLTKALAAYSDLGEEKDLAMALHDLGRMAMTRNDYERADELFHQGLELSEKTGSKEQQARIYVNLGSLALKRYRLNDAHSWYAQTLTLAQEVKQQELMAGAQAGLAQVLELQGHPAEALPVAEESLRICEGLHNLSLDRTRQLVERLRKRIGK